MGDPIVNPFVCKGKIQGSIHWNPFEVWLCLEVELETPFVYRNPVEMLDKHYKSIGVHSCYWIMFLIDYSIMMFLFLLTVKWVLY